MTADRQDGASSAASGSSALPSLLSLPSGRRVRVDARRARRAVALCTQRRAAPRALELLAAPDVLHDARGGPCDVGDLALADAHVLIAFVCRAGLAEESEVDMACDNCDRRQRVRPSSALEAGPFVDGELCDPEIDAGFDFDAAHPIPPVFTSSGLARTVRLAPRTVADTELLRSALPGSLRMSRAVTIALGVQALGRERSSAKISRALARASDDAWTALAELWERAHYPARLVVEVLCSCGARNQLLAPSDRELDAVAPIDPAALPRDARAPVGFPSLQEFEAMAARARRVAYAARGVRNVPVFVDDGVPACDEGGEPLLGCYDPPGADGGGFADQGPEIRLFYRTFQSEFRFDPSFDVEAEVRETIEHEVEHHLYFLSGSDPMDEEERAVIARDRARSVGKKELVRREARAAAADFAGFLRAGFPLLVTLVVLALVLYTCDWRRR